MKRKTPSIFLKSSLEVYTLGLSLVLSVTSLVCLYFSDEGAVDSPIEDSSTSGVEESSAQSTTANKSRNYLYYGKVALLLAGVSLFFYLGYLLGAPEAILSTKPNLSKAELLLIREAIDAIDNEAASSGSSSKEEDNDPPSFED